MYVTGHSLGGALATVAAWYLDSAHLAACYTFGAPRIGTSSLGPLYRTPIYRIVNGADPVPNVPPSGTLVTSLKIILRWFPYTQWLVKQLVKVQNYSHYGDQRYLSICSTADNYDGLDVYTNISALGRLVRWATAIKEGKYGATLKLVHYHDISVYRTKLKIWAKQRQGN